MFGNMHFTVVALTVCCLLQPSLQQGKSGNCDKANDKHTSCGDGNQVCSPIGGSEGSKLKCVPCSCAEAEQCYVATKGDIEASCLCPEGRTGQYYIDYCVNNECEAVCVDGETSYTCECPAGSTLNEDGLTCPDIDECSLPAVQAACQAPFQCEENDPMAGYCCTLP